MKRLFTLLLTIIFVLPLYAQEFDGQSCTALMVGKKASSDGWFTIEELERVALQRCDNARDAIRLMGALAKQYGYGDSGECLTVADKNEL